MSLLAIGLNHRSAPPELLERVAVSPQDVPKVLHDLLAGEDVSEAVLLTTCNRVEIYAETATFHGGVTEVGEVLVRSSGLPLEELHPSLYVHHEARAVQHLFSVACGLDSMLVGEAQILGQVRQAYKIAQEESAAGRGLSELMREALRVGKRAHADTGIDLAAASLVGVALRVAGEAVSGQPGAVRPAPGQQPLRGASVLLVGAGSTGALVGTLLRKAEIGELIVANRSLERAKRLAKRLDARAVGLDAIPAALRTADLVVTATGATLPVLAADAIEAAVADRPGRGLVLLDLGLPRDVEPRARALAGVTLIDLEGLRPVLAASDVVTDVEAVRALVTDEVAAYLDRQRALRVAPTVAALRARAAEMVAIELDRLSGRLPTLSEREREEVAVTVRRVVDKLLHSPTVRVKELAESPGGDRYAEALHELFELDPRKAQAVSSPGLDELPGSGQPATGRMR
jgi:glutamyl-tRNA reductase